MVRISPLAVAALCASLLSPIAENYLPFDQLPLKSWDGNIPSFLYNLLFPLPGFILGICALISIRRNMSTITGEKFAIFGILISILVITPNIMSIQTDLPYSDPSTAHCMSKQRQLLYAIEIYAQDHDYRMPTSFNDLGGEIQQYHCPELTNSTLRGIGYNGLLRNIKLSNILAPEATLTTADSREQSGIITDTRQIDTTRHSHHIKGYFWRYPRGYIVSYLDGHVEIKKSSDKVTLK